MNEWNQFNHCDLQPHLKAIVDKVQPMGAQVSSCGAGKITIEWPDGKTVFVRRFRQGPYRWLLFMASSNQLMHLEGRDPSMSELRTGLQDQPLAGRVPKPPGPPPLGLPVDHLEPTEFNTPFRDL
jgi:hypothetical protein